ncbi:hypothetical protein LTR62_002740 [Meristemomyces frigidus]|uniref:CinA C-terminal domain-containing protein n=1 Tax=Meristemomyces frigidus TaxID=1508187 RepID=A0AAN7TLM1_9PEZI|nr:hypothetical protein LTR62_002740 [Meristemomyces frigidus]
MSFTRSSGSLQVLLVNGSRKILGASATQLYPPSAAFSDVPVPYSHHQIAPNPAHQTQRTMSTITTTPSFPPREILPILHEITALLKSRNETLSIAETASGGLISSSLLSQPGASSIYKGGLTLYTLPSRIAYAGWSQETIANYKGPTTEIVSGLARHVRRELESTYTIAESGTAGPTGGTTPNRRPGYVALAVDCERGTFTRELDTGLGGHRVGNMVQFAVEALTLLREVILGEAKL